eukprot:CAMPEP_0170848622 /NCGR_PEP_ID=MMETSP0734-20130129/9489_1 /TAXON_ID=186038 /ORGANISM="Fragilariopsis kerguelensis, Strain L26-C5" /LENGTH=114 /DNA_ID=CAMNT_0011218069 /DNA_START=187 /DNA_END=531 /DNA_ORIENTATION=-
MPTENTSFQNTTPAGDSNTTPEMVIAKSKTYQRQFLIAVAGSSLALFLLFAVACKTAGYSLTYTGGLDGSDTANLALTEDIFDAKDDDVFPACDASTCMKCACNDCNWGYCMVG